MLFRVEEDQGRESMQHCDLRLRWEVASGLRVWAAISEPETPSFCRISGDLAPSTRKSLAIAIVRFWCANQGFPRGVFVKGGEISIIGVGARTGCNN